MIFWPRQRAALDLGEQASAPQRERDERMPLYEYRCTQCEQTFEQLVQSSEVPRCPSCSSDQLEKLFSVFAVGGASERPGDIPEACRRCGDPRGPGACGMA